MKVMKKRDGNGGGGGVEVRWARRQSTCVQSRKVRSPSSSDRQTGLSGEFIFTSI